jgi:hypothetical protein
MPKNTLEKLAKKVIKDHFRETGDGVIFCPHLIWDENTKGQVYFSNDLWLAVCKIFIDKAHA